MNMSTPMSPKPMVNATCKLGKQGCFEDGRCHALGNCEHKIVTNADRIRAMSDEELARFVATKIGNLENHKMAEQGHTPTATQLSALGQTMYRTLMNWLRQPVEG